MVHPLINARRILERARQKHDPEHVFLLYSGGDDSAVSTHLAYRFFHDVDVTVAHIDTGTGFPVVQDHTEEVADQFAWPLRIIGPDDHSGKSFTEWVKQNGMPGPTGHSYVYEHLKQRAIEQLQREAKDGWWDRILFITGVYQAESERRAEIHTGPMDRKGCRVMVNPCLRWSPQHFHDYRTRHDIPQNPVTKVLGKSGECLCGAFAGKGELERIRLVDEEVADRIERIQEQAKGPWGYEDRGPPEQWKMEQEGQQRLPLCTDCKA